MQSNEDMAKDQMKVIHITEDFSMSNTGVTMALKELVSHVFDRDMGMAVLAVGSNAVQVPEDVVVHLCPELRAGLMWRYSSSFSSVLKGLLTSKTVFHIHGAWMAPQFLAARSAFKISIPTILTSHGMLEPWLWDEQGWCVRFKKQAYWRAMAYPAFRHLTVVHAITPLERDNLKNLFPGQRIEVIPNAIDLSAIDAQFKGFFSDLEPLIFFLGRMHPKKGIDILVRAFAHAQLAKKWRLVIAGPTEVPRYLKELKSFVNESGMQDRVNFIGPVFGAEKWKWLKRAWVVAVPSRSEVVGMVNLEAAACNIPTITTYETGLWDWEEGGGRLIHPDTDELAEALRESCAWSGSERNDRGRASRQLVEQRYGMDVVGRLWSGLYKELTEGG